MQFKHPEILYALLLLIIPIIIHLFQLQRFVKTPFTNVQFLKKLKLQTRKSSRLKKWLILLTRLGAFATIIFAFAQPFFSDSKQHQKYTTTIYLDNSLSMQLQNSEGEILKTAVQKIIENTKDATSVSLITNDKVFKNLNAKSLKNELINIKYSSKKIGFNTILLKASQLNSTERNTTNNTILISDFQNINGENKNSVTNVNSSISLINLATAKISNVSIDSLYISNSNTKEITLKVVLKNTNVTAENFSVSLYNDTFLTGKTTTPLSKNKASTVEFKIPNQGNFNGTVIIEDENLAFDNTLFFSISKPEKINVISIGKKANFLSKIYTKTAFNFTQKNSRNLDYTSIQNQNLLILNELDKIPVSLTSALQEFLQNGGNIVVIPSENSDSNSYNQFFSQLKLGVFSKSIKKTLKITNINFSHPILHNVFESEFKNFQYPTVNQYFKYTSNASSILSFENEQAFVSEIKSNKGSVYLFSSPINKMASNFKKSPLIVPLFYNFGKYSYKIPQLYYTLGSENTIEVKTEIQKDEVLKLSNKLNTFIPLQQAFFNKVQLTTNKQPTESGFYEISRKNKVLRSVSYNYNREESKLEYANLNTIFKDIENVSISNSITDTFTRLNEQQQIKPLFKWFLALAILFLLLEIFILKFFKV